VADIYPKALSRLEYETVISKIRDSKPPLEKLKPPSTGTEIESQEDMKLPDDAASDVELTILMLPLTDEQITKIRNCEILNFKYKVGEAIIPLAVFKDGVQNGKCVPD
jgi:hypothetical protein